MSQTKRLIDIHNLISQGRCPSPQELAERLHVTRRQIFLDRKKLVEEWGAPLAFDRKKGGWVYRDKTWVLPTTVFSEGELLAFFLSVEIARSQTNAAVSESLKSAIDKISRSLGDAVTVNLNALNDATHVEPPPAAPLRAEIYWELTLAKAHRSKVEMRYYTAKRDEWNTRVVHPYHLLLSRGECFLVAWDENRKEVRSFNIARIETLRRLEARFLMADDFDLAAYKRKMLWAEAGPTLYEIVVRFDAYQARYIRERKWHDEQQNETLSGGGLIVRFPASGLEEVARWVLGYGQHAEALEPMELRTLVRQHIVELARIYGGDE